jgi:MFS transporter, ACDE family, multidrug resistance protein
LRRANVQTAKPRLPREVWILITAATFVITAFAAMRLCFAPVSGLLVQRLGERRVYVTGILTVSLSTGACALAQSYWQLLIFRSLGGIGSTMFFVSSLGLMIRVSPEDARGRVAGMFATAFLIGSVGGPVLGSLTAGLGLSTPFVIYGVALLIAAAVVFFSLRHSPLAAPQRLTEPPVTLRVALHQKAYRAALLSNFATGWSVFGLRMALVPLFVSEVLGRGAGMADVALATFAAGNVSAVIPSGYVSDRIGRRTLLIIGLTESGVATAIVGWASSLPLFLAGAFLAGAAADMFSSPQQAAVADIIGSKASAGTALATFQMMADFGSIAGSFAVGEIAQHLSFGTAFVISGGILVVAAAGWVCAPGTRAHPPAEPTPARALGPAAGGELP